MSGLPAAFEKAIARDFPADFLSVDPADLTTFGRDWTRVFEPRPSAVALPRSTDEVARLLRLCSEHRVPVVPSGGRTGLAAGAVAARGELVVSLSRMRRMDPVDVLGATVRVQAGAVTEAVHQHAAAHGLTWPVDFASKGSSQVGGNISTNAGGVKVIRVGPFVIMAYEFFTERCLARLRRHRSVRAPLSAPSDYYVLLEVERGEREALDAWIASLFERGMVTDGTLAQHSAQAASLWTLREGISESLSAATVRAGDRERLERLCLYGARPCFSLARLSVLAHGRVA